MLAYGQPENKVFGFAQKKTVCVSMGEWMDASATDRLLRFARRIVLLRLLLLHD